MDFAFDVFLSHSSKDKAIVHALAERLKKDGLRVWLDSWILKPGDSIPAKIEHGLEHSCVLVLCMSAHAFGSDWAQLEPATFRFRDPLNRDRRFIPLRLDDAPINGSLAQFLYINWVSNDREQEYAKLLEACRPLAKPQVDPTAHRVMQFDYELQVMAYGFSPDGKHVLRTGFDNSVRLWDVQTGHCLRVFGGHTEKVNSVALSIDQLHALSGADDKTIRLWDVEAGRCLRILADHVGSVTCIAWGADRRLAASGSSDRTVRLWDVKNGRCLRIFQGHAGPVNDVVLSADHKSVLSAANDNTLRLWEVDSGQCARTFTGHTDIVVCLALSPNQSLALSGSQDKTVRLWDVKTGQCVRILEGHTDSVACLAWRADNRLALSGSVDGTIRLWDLRAGSCHQVLKGHTGPLEEVSWVADQTSAISGDLRGVIRLWDLRDLVTASRARKKSPQHRLTQVEYTNAKVLLIGETGVGKTGLAKVLAGERWQPSDSTVGAWATQWKLPVSSSERIEREIWLWDFGGQADQRLIHQLYMDDTAVAVLVFDGQKQDVFETLGQWDRDLTRASRKALTKLLVAGRIDAGGLRISRTQLEGFAKERGFSRLLETSAKLGTGCDKLKTAILGGINWDDIPWRSSPAQFKRLKDEIIRLKDTGLVLIRLNELRETLQLRLSGQVPSFTGEEVKAVVGLLAGPGVVSELKFGNWVLLQPEFINAYAQAVIQTMRADELERGCLPEDQVLNADLTYHSSMPRLKPEDERFVILAMHQILLERGLCQREHTDEGPLLIFPSYYRRERPDLIGHPAVVVSYRFTGFLDDIYATLVVQLHHIKSFQSQQLWRYAADFKTLTNKSLGVKMTRRAEGAGEIEVYFAPSIPVGEKIIFSKYVHEHLLHRARDVVRLRHYVCKHCDTPVGNREVAMERLQAWLQGGSRGRSPTWLQGGSRGKRPTIICSKCERRVPLWDDMEEYFAKPEIQQRVRDLQDETAFALGNESDERSLVGEVISTISLAGQICRELIVNGEGIDMEVEFKFDTDSPTGRKVYLQLRVDKYYLRKEQVTRETPASQAKTNGEYWNQDWDDDHEEDSDYGSANTSPPQLRPEIILTIKDKREAGHWTDLRSPIILLMRTAKGAIQWMDVTDHLKRGPGKEEDIVFRGKRFDVMSVRNWREKALGP